MLPSPDGLAASLLPRDDAAIEQDATDVMPERADSLLRRHPCRIAVLALTLFSTAVAASLLSIKSPVIVLGSNCHRMNSIWVIRHGERSDSEKDTQPGLNSTGRKRAQYLSHLVEDGTWPYFDAVFASSPNEPPYSRRTLETVEPLAAAIGIDVDISFSKDDIPELAKAVTKKAGKCGAAVLVSFEHCRIPSLLPLLGCSEPECVACWGDGVYDRVIILEQAQSHMEEWDKKQVVLTVDREGYANDVEGFGEYECAAPKAALHTRCEMPDGSWLKPPGTPKK